MSHRSAPTSLRLSLVLGLVLTTLSLAPAPADTKPALEENPTGWVDLLADAGANPTTRGWTREPLPVSGKPLTERSPWTFDPRAKVLTCRGDEAGHEWLRWDEPVGNAIVHVEWRFVPAEPGRPTKYNSGMYVRNSADAAIWHQAQMGNASGGWLFGETPVQGEKKRVDLSKTVTDKRVKPAGEWNTFEVTAVGKDVSVWANGAVVCTWHDCEVARGYLGLEAEGYQIEFRNVRFKSFDPAVPTPHQP